MRFVRTLNYRDCGRQGFLAVSVACWNECSVDGAAERQLQSAEIGTAQIPSST